MAVQHVEVGCLDAAFTFRVQRKPSHQRMGRKGRRRRRRRKRRRGRKRVITSIKKSSRSWWGFWMGRSEIESVGAST